MKELLHTSLLVPIMSFSDPTIVKLVSIGCDKEVIRAQNHTTIYQLPESESILLKAM